MTDKSPNTRKRWISGGIQSSSPGYKKLAMPCDPELPVFGAAHYHERRDAGQALVAAGFVWNTDESCWISACGEIRASVRFSQSFNKFYISSVL